MIIKPFKKVIDEPNEAVIKKEVPVKPFKVKSEKVLKIDDIYLNSEKFTTISADESSFQRTVNFFSTFNGIVVAIFIFIPT